MIMCLDTPECGRDDRAVSDNGGVWKLVGARVRTERDKRNWTQDDLAAFAGLSRPTIQNIESGKGGFSRTTLRRLERGFHWMPGSITTISAGGEPVEDRADSATEARSPMYFLIRSLVLEHGAARFTSAVTEVFYDLGASDTLPP
jgi:transcriptional regulator with XRE-family HTH domain